MSSNPVITKKIYEKNLLGRDIYVGDIHGDLKTFETLLSEIKFNSSVDRIFSCGDILDRGDLSLEVLQLSKEHWFNVTRGNHEEFINMLMHECYSCLISGGSAKDFVKKYAETIKMMGSFWVWDLAMANKLNEDLVIEIINLTDQNEIVNISLIKDEIDIYTTHAGLPCGVKLKNLISNLPTEITEVSDFVSKSMWEIQNDYVLKSNPIKLKDCVSKLKEQSEIIFHGHTIFEVPLVVNNQIFLDTGCGFKSIGNKASKLSAIIWQEEKYFSICTQSQQSEFFDIKNLNNFKNK